MKPIKISIRDYQSIESLDLELSGFTCITGPTNIGKSAVVRAISSAILNKSVVGAVRKGKKFCSVDIDGLKWEKGERVGRYWVPGEDKPRDGIGQGQTEVTEILGFRSVKVGDKYINPWLATQFNQIFLMEDSGPAVTDFISDIAHLKSLQNAIVHCTRARARLLTSIKEREEDAIRLSGKEDALSGVDNLLHAEKDLVAQMDSLEEYARTISRLRAVIDSSDVEKKAIAALSDYSAVRVPKKPADPAESLMTGASLWASMERAAVLILAVKPVTKVDVPVMADTEAVEEMRSRSRFLAVPSLSRSVSALEPVSTVAVPPSPGHEGEAMREAARTLSAITRAERRTGSLEILFAQADPVFGRAAAGKIDHQQLDSALAGAKIMASLKETAAGLKAVDDDISEMELELKRVLEEMAKIPTCPTCKQVFVQAHAH